MRILAGLLSVALLLAPTFAHADLAAVESLVAKKAAIVEMMHSKARKALVTAAQDDRYREYFVAGSADERARLKAEIDRISLKVQAEFHVEEMCLIDHHGAEISRIVQNSIAYDLATNETQNVFFTPGFALQARTVYISPLYVSQDANRWVLGYATPDRGRRRHQGHPALRARPDGLPAGPQQGPGRRHQVHRRGGRRRPS